MYCKEAERIQEMKEGQCGSNSQRVGKGQAILASQAMLRTLIFFFNFYFTYLLI